VPLSNPPVAATTATLPKRAGEIRRRTWGIAFWVIALSLHWVILDLLYVGGHWLAHFGHALSMKDATALHQWAFRADAWVGGSAAVLGALLVRFSKNQGGLWAGLVALGAALFRLGAGLRFANAFADPLSDVDILGARFFHLWIFDALFVGAALLAIHQRLRTLGHSPSRLFMAWVFSTFAFAALFSLTYWNLAGIKPFGVVGVLKVMSSALFLMLSAPFLLRLRKAEMLS
jgi:hypothetical protein